MKKINRLMSYEVCRWWRGFSGWGVGEGGKEKVV